MRKSIVVLSWLAYVLVIIQGCKKSSSVPEPIKPPPDPVAVQISVMAFVGVPQEQTNIARYEEMRSAGITLSYSIFSDVNAMQQALDIALRTGIKLFISCPELKTDPEGTVRRFMTHGALAGYYLSDEPASSLFPALGSLVNRIKAIDNQHPCYINLLPNFADAIQMGVPTYREYVNSFIKQVPVQLLSFDNYPIIGITNQSIRPNWYENLEAFSDEARKANKPFWAFALTTAHSPYPVATLPALRLQVYTNLAYGAQGIQLFTYWNLYDPGGYDFNNSPIGLDGIKTPVYDLLKSITTEIKNLSGVFLDAKVISVAHTGTAIPIGTTRLTMLPQPVQSLTTTGLGATVSVMEKGTDAYLVIVNRDFTDVMSLSLTCVAGVTRVLKDGTENLADVSTETIVVQPGDVAIYKWKK